MKIQNYIVLSVLTVALIGMAGCGSSSSTSDGSGGPQLIILENNLTADVVVGQEDMNSSNSNTVAANTMDSPYGNAFVDNGVLYLHDYSSNRVLVYNTIPTENNTSADYVLGQVDLNSSDSGSGASEMDGPQSVAVSDGKLFITEYSNNRVLIYNSVPTDGPGTADVVVGQEDFNLSTSDCTAYNLSQPETMTVVNGKLIITDSSNNRVLIYNTIPTENNASADIVLGQNSFTTCANNDDNQDGIADANPTSRTLLFPAGVWSDGKRLVINDYDNSRTLIWNTFPTSSFQAADIVLGQATFDMNTANDDDQDGTEDANPTARTLNYPYDGVYSNGKQLFVADTSNNRILGWNTFPTENFQPADVVLGQTDMNSSTSDTTANTLSSPNGVYQYGNKLIVTDQGNSRYLIYNGL